MDTMDAHLRSDIAEATDCLVGFLDGVKPIAGVILGSGLNFFADTLDDARHLPFADVPHLKVSTAEGHVGRFVCGRVPGSDRYVLCMQGRLHGYEGNSASEVAFPVWTMRSAGIPVLITTNAVGAINPAFTVGDFCLMSDMINFTGRNPLVGTAPAKMAQRFVPMMDAFDPDLRTLAHSVADEADVALYDGVYLGLLGPSFETPAEIRMFSKLGADTVAMSLVEEVIAARHLSMRVMGISLLSNMACGVGDGDPTSEEVMDVALTAEPRFARLLSGILRKL